MAKVVDSNYKAVEAQLRRGPGILFAGVALSNRDRRTVASAFGLWASLANEVSPRSSTLSPIKVYCRHLRSGVLDVRDLGKFLKAIDKKFLSIVTSNVDLSRVAYIRFKRECECAGPTFWGFISPIARLFDILSIHLTVIGIRNVHQYLSFLSKISLSDINIDNELEDEYITDEMNLKNQDLSALSGIISRIFPDRPSDLRIKHGPHSVAEVDGRTIGTRQKNQVLTYDRKLQKLFDLPLHCSQYSYETCNRTSKIVFVPKTMITKRIISKEPAGLQMCQQALLTWMNSCIKTSWLHRHYTPENQGHSRDLAQKGSIRGDFDTIDLSKASDSVTWSGVKSAFKKTDLLPFLDACRSSKTELPSGRIVELKKFAPMGSACCFPIETIIFSSICCLAAEQVGPYDYIVYGDDIVCDHRLTQRITELLSSFDFIVNVDKTFCGANLFTFREACGIECLNGIDISPMRLSRKFAGRFDSSSFVSWISLSNRAYSHRLLFVRREIFRQIKEENAEWLSWVQFVTEDQSHLFGLVSFYSSVSNYRLRKRSFSVQFEPSKKNLQRPECRILIPHTSSNCNDVAEDCELDLFLWFSHASDSDDVMRPMKQDRGAFEARLKKTWVFYQG